MGNRNYGNIARPVALTVAVASSDTTLTVASTTGYPAVPFILGLERTTSSEEVVLCTAKTSTTFTVTRGYDGTNAVSHPLGGLVEHTTAAIDYQEPSDHIVATIAHGLTSAIVGRDDTQTLTHKTLSGASNTFTAIPDTALVGISTSKLIGDVDADTLSGHEYTVGSATPTSPAKYDVWIKTTF